MSNPLHAIFGLQDDGLPLVFLAPIAGYSDPPMRRISHRNGAALTYTEMVSARGLLDAEGRSWSLLETAAGEGPVVAHLYGTDPGAFAEAAARVEQTGRFVAIDLNAGCPARKVLADGAGAELIKDPQRIHDILAAIRGAVSLPVTLKTRLGPSPDRVAIYEVLAAAETAGAAALTLHGRFTSQGHGGTLHIDAIGDVKRRAKIPVIGNGNVYSPYAAWHMLETTGVDALMIARAAIGNPWIFRNIRASFASGVRPEFHPPTHNRPRMDLGTIAETLEAHLALQLEHRQMLHGKYGIPPEAEGVEEGVANVFRCHLFRYLHTLKGAGHVRRRLCELRTLADVRAAVSGCLAREAEFRASAPEKQQND